MHKTLKAPSKINKATLITSIHGLNEFSIVQVVLKNSTEGQPNYQFIYHNWSKLKWKS